MTKLEELKAAFDDAYAAYDAAYDAAYAAYAAYQKELEKQNDKNS